MFFQIVSELTDFTVRTNETECHESLRNEAFAYMEDMPSICSFINYATTLLHKKYQERKKM